MAKRESLVLAFYAESEGSTDQQFLPLIIERTAEHILVSKERNDVLVLPVVVIELDEPKPTRRKERIVAAARKAAGYHGLIVHADADGPNRNKALKERFD